MKLQVYRYTILRHPIKDEGKTQMIIPPTYLMAKDQATAVSLATMEIPAAYKSDIDQLEVIVRPF